MLYKMHNTFTTQNKLGSVFFCFFFYKNDKEKHWFKKKKGHVEFEKTKHVPFIHSPVILIEPRKE